MKNNRPSQLVKTLEMEVNISCADPEIFVRGSPNLITFRVGFFSS